MEINIISVGRLKERYLQEGIDEFIKRLRPYSRINMIELADERIPANPSLKEQEAIKNKEGERILSSLGERTYVIALDIKGKPMSSEGLARSIQDLQVQGYSSISFIIGGALG
ncbi:MAG: 23S rRNA (pseudouridine(1915)-N(3))-methyltransferase RlmH, partial [Halanaerobiales bacterium]